MENPYVVLEERLAGIEDLLNTVLAKINEIEKPGYEIFGDINDCSEWINKSSSTIYKMVSQKKIPHIKNGKKLLFKRDEITTWLISQRKATFNEIQEEVDKNLQKQEKCKSRA